ncbi:BtrH N-terminal domain-containing protein [Geodermatophilus sp. SYSU D00691]
MTRQKHLKDLVRARMERTGERYSTARRHLAGAPEPDPGSEHDSLLLTRVLQAAGVADRDGRPLSEPLVAGLAGGIGFMYFSFSYAGQLPTMTIVPRIHPRPFVAGALERAGIAHRVVGTTSAAKAARELDAALAAGRTPVCTVDLAALPHRRWVVDVPGASPHDVAVLGREDGAVLLDDALAEPVRLPGDAFAAARSTHRQSKHRMVVVEPSQPVDLVPAIRAALAVTVHDLTEDVIAGNFAGNFGLRGMAKWADAVADHRSRNGWARLFDSRPAFHSAMHRLHDCLTAEYSSPGATRPLYAAFLTTAADLLDEPALRETAARYAEAGRLWTRIAEEAVGGPLAPYRELWDRRTALLTTPDRVEEIRAVAAEAAELIADGYSGQADRQTRLDAIAELAAAVVPVEREACAALAQVAGA